jgi:adenine deaminase
VSRQALVDVALGVTAAEVAIRGGTVVDVWTGELRRADVAIHGGRIACVGDVADVCDAQTEIIDATGQYLAPGLLDGHLHAYHTYLDVEAHVETSVVRGVTGWVDGFYAPGIVGGFDAVRFFKDAYAAMPIRLLFVVPVLAWLQNRELGLTPTPGITVADMHEMLEWDDCVGIEEPQPIGVFGHWPEMAELFDATLRLRKVVNGHASGLSEREIQAYAAAGAGLDHESHSPEDALIKARAGMRLLMREGSGAPNLGDVIRAHTELGVHAQAFGICTDLASAEKAYHEGTVDHAVRQTIRAGVAPLEAIRMATLNVAQAFRVDHDLGVLAPGRLADVLLLDDLTELVIDRVVVGGAVVARHGELVAPLPAVDYPASFAQTVSVERTLSGRELTIAAPLGDETVTARVIGMVPGTLITDERLIELPVVEGRVQRSAEADVIHLAMVDRFGKGTGVGLGFAQGFGLRRGAFASTANALCENLIVAGTDPDDMAVALAHLVAIGGGQCAVVDGEVVADVAFPILGLQSRAPLKEVMERFGRLTAALAAMGCTIDAPFSQLEFCFAVGALGDLKLSEEGLLRIHPPERVDVLVP